MANNSVFDLNDPEVHTAFNSADTHSEYRQKVLDVLQKHTFTIEQVTGTLTRQLWQRELHMYDKLTMLLCRLRSTFWTHKPIHT